MSVGHRQTHRRGWDGMRPLGTRFGRGAVITTLMLVAGLALTACDGPSQTITPAPTPTQPPLSLSITPATGTAKAPVSTEVGLTVGNGTISSVTLTKAGGGAVTGAVRDDGSSWIPSQALDYGSTYTAVVQASSPDGKQK